MSPGKAKATALALQLTSLELVDDQDNIIVCRIFTLLTRLGTVLSHVNRGTVALSLLPAPCGLE